MDGNKDEATRCLDIALAALKQGNLQRAEKFARKAENLYPTEEAKSLLDAMADISRNGGTPGSRASDEPAAARHRATSSHQQPAAEPKERDYTDAQLEMVRRIKRCGDYYEVLSITKDSTDTDIKKAYKRLALQLHPDKNRAPGSVEAFKSVGNAVAVLTDPQKRKAYDLYGVDGPNGGGGGQQAYHRGEQRPTGEYTFSRGFESEFTADELFNMFFGTGFQQQRMNQRNQRQYAQTTEAGRPGIAFLLILMMIGISVMTTFFSSDPVYSLSASTRYPIRRHTAHLNVQYFVKEHFENDYQGSLARLEKSVEEEYIAVMKQNCYRERNYRDMMISRASIYDSRTYLKQAQDLKVPSCENLARIGITKYMPY